MEEETDKGVKARTVLQHWLGPVESMHGSTQQRCTLVIELHLSGRHARKVCINLGAGVNVAMRGACSGVHCAAGRGFAAPCAAPLHTLARGR